MPIKRQRPPSRGAAIEEMCSVRNGSQHAFAFRFGGFAVAMRDVPLVEVGRRNARHIPGLLGQLLPALPAIASVPDHIGVGPTFLVDLDLDGLSRRAQRFVGLAVVATAFGRRMPVAAFFIRPARGARGNHDTATTAQTPVVRNVDVTATAAAMMPTPRMTAMTTGPPALDATIAMDPATLGAATAIGPPTLTAVTTCKTPTLGVPAIDAMTAICAMAPVDAMTPICAMAPVEATVAREAIPAEIAIATHAAHAAEPAITTEISAKAAHAAHTAATPDLGGKGGGLGGVGNAFDRRPDAVGH